MHFAINGRSSCDDAGVRIDREQIVRVAAERVSDRVGGRVEIERVGSDTNCCANRDVLIDLIGCVVGIRRRRDIELIEIVNRDREVLRSCGTIA